MGVSRMRSFIKKSVLMLLFLFLFINHGIGYAEENKEPEKQLQLPLKASILVLFVNSSNMQKEYVDTIKQNLQTVLSKYDLINGDKYVEQLYKNGITDLVTAEKQDILDVIKDEKANYLLLMDMQSFEGRIDNLGGYNNMTISPRLFIRITNLDTNKNLYNGKIGSVFQHQWHALYGFDKGSKVAFKTLIADLDKVLLERFPQ